VRRLIIRPGAIGDTIVSLPALERLCPAGQGADYAEIWAPQRNLPLLRHLAPARAFSAVQLDMLEIDPPAALLERLSEFDEVVSWYGAARPEFRAALERTGVPFQLLRALPGQESTLHAVDFYLRQAGVEPPADAPILPRLPEFAAVPPPERPFIAIHPFSGSPKKNWDLTQFKALAERLEQATRMPVEWTAGPEEPLPEARRFEGLDELARWLAGASLYVGNDSGPSHLAAACGVPSVVIFRASDAAVWAPRGSHVAVLQNPDLPTVEATARELLRGVNRTRGGGADTNLYIL
jgi:ADP-heptose:LPS heptosyltransferase